MILMPYRYKHGATTDDYFNNVCVLAPLNGVNGATTFF